jgi:hypothetical protein
LLLRDNRQSGPYSLEELRALPLRTTDLVWIEHTSTQWEYAKEVDALRDAVKPYAAPRYEPRPWPREEVKPESVKLQPPPFRLNERNAAVEAKVLPMPRRRRETSGLWIMALMAMLFFGAFVVKKLVEHTPNNTATMTPVALRIPAEKDTDDNLAYHNAITTETVYGGPDAVALRTAIDNLKKYVRIQPVQSRLNPVRAVQDTELEIINGTAEDLDKIDVEVTWLKSNGKVKKTETFAVHNISALSKKILVIPGNAKIRYKVAHITTSKNALPQVAA